MTILMYAVQIMTSLQSQPTKYTQGATIVTHSIALILLIYLFIWGKIAFGMTCIPFIYLFCSKCLFFPQLASYARPVFNFS